MSTAESKKNKQNCNAKKKKTLMIGVAQYLLGAFVSLATSDHIDSLRTSNRGNKCFAILTRKSPRSHNSIVHPHHYVWQFLTSNGHSEPAKAS